MSDDFWGGMFDFNNDGKMDSFERAAEFGFFMQMMDEMEKSDRISTQKIIPKMSFFFCHILS